VINRRAARSSVRDVEPGGHAEHLKAQSAYAADLQAVA
jgi:hypothetical protein